MTAKTKFKLLSTRPLNFHANWIKSLVNEYFDLEIHDPSKTYDYASTLIITYYSDTNPVPDMRCVIDNLWERKIKSAHYVLQNENWFWYYGSLQYKHLGYDLYQPNRIHRKMALMPMRRIRLYRDFLLKELTTILDNLIWSYVDRGCQLPNDLDINDGSFLLYFNPEWYDQTCFSIVAESGVNSDPLHPIFITEKTYKPIAFQHPFVVFGDKGTLSRLHTLGFVTFDNLFNESYDSVVNWQQRGHAVVQAIKDFKIEPYTTETQQRLKHNHAHFFNEELVKQRMRVEILEPLLNYAETR